MNSKIITINCNYMSRIIKKKDVMVRLCVGVSVICGNINGADGPLGLCHHLPAKSLISYRATAGSEGGH